jgi:hypothetical protein
MALDTSGNWVAGDDLRLIEALGLPFGTYTLDCAQKCMNELEDMSPEAVLRVRALLDEYEAAKLAESNSNLADTEGKVLVKADVLEWEVTGTGQASGAQQEMNRAQHELAQYFAFCSCMGSALPGSGGGYYGSGSLIRS